MSLTLQSLLCLPRATRSKVRRFAGSGAVGLFGRDPPLTALMVPKTSRPILALWMTPDRGHFSGVSQVGDAYRPYPVTVGDWSVCPPFKLESSTVPSVIVTPEGIPERERRSDSETG